MSANDSVSWRKIRTVPVRDASDLRCPVCRETVGIVLVWEPGMDPRLNTGGCVVDNSRPGYGMRLECGCQFRTDDGWVYVGGQLLMADMPQGGWCTQCPTRRGATWAAAECCRAGTQMRVVCPWCDHSTATTGMRAGPSTTLYGLVPVCCDRPLVFARPGSSGWDTDPAQEAPVLAARLRRVQYAGPWVLNGVTFPGPVYLPALEIAE